jgi:predicted porin
MKLKLAIVVLASLVSTAAHAQSKPTLQWYGIADFNLAAQNTGAGYFLSVNSGGFLASRLGIKGEAPLNDLVTAVYVAEAGMQFDTAVVGNNGQPTGINNSAASSGGANGTGPQFFGRQMFAGLRSQVGTLTAGRQYTPNYLIAAAFALPWPGMFGNTSTLTAQTGMPFRVNNSLIYVSPTVGGLQLAADGFAGLENNTRGNVPSGTAFTNAKAGRGGDGSLTFRSGIVSVSAGAWYYYANTFATGETELAIKKGYQAALVLDLKVLSLYGIFGQGKISGGNYENVTKALSKSTTYGGSVLVPFGNNRVTLNYSKLNDQSPLNKDAELLGVQYWYNFTPQSTVYAAGGYMLNHGNSTYTVTDSGGIVASSVTPGAEGRSIQVGFCQQF